MGRLVFGVPGCSNPKCPEFIEAQHGVPAHYTSKDTMGGCTMRPRGTPGETKMGVWGRGLRTPTPLTPPSLMDGQPTRRGEGARASWTDGRWDGGYWWRSSTANW